MSHTNEPLSGQGESVSEHFTGKAWMNMISSQAAYDCNIYNVAFAPSSRNFGHSHSQGEIVSIVLYQERGEPARKLEWEGKVTEEEYN